MLPKSWYLQTFHPVSKSRQPLQRVSKFCLYFIYFDVKSCMFWSWSRIGKQGSQHLSESLIYHSSPLLFFSTFGLFSWRLMHLNATIKVYIAARFYSAGMWWSRTWLSQNLDHFFSCITSTYESFSWIHTTLSPGSFGHYLSLCW